MNDAAPSLPGLILSGRKVVVVGGVVAGAHPERFAEGGLARV